MKNFAVDPLNEEKYQKTKGAIHKYNSRILILISIHCPQMCPFCFRKRITAKPREKLTLNDLNEIIKYTGTQPEVNEVIFSGGEPLMEPELLIYGLKEFSKLKQIKILRIHSRAPVSAPNLITPKILIVLKNIFHIPLYFSVHINHSKELSPECIKSINLLKKSGAILISQTVFLKGINDNFETLKELFTKLSQAGVMPYYLHHCDPVAGNKKFIVPLEKEVEIVTQLRKNLSGLACPTLVIDSPNGVGKIPVPFNFWKFDINSFSDFNGKIIKTN